MAEEEILQQAAPAKKKKIGGGGISFTQVIIIAVALIVLTAVFVTIVNKKVGVVGEDVSGKILQLKESQDTSNIINVRDRNAFRDCSSIVKLQDKPLLVNMADGQHYLSTEISICLDPNFKAEGKAKVEDVFSENKDKVLYACNEYLSTLSYSTMFQTVTSPAPAAAAANGELSLDNASEGTPDFSRRMDQVRGELLKVLQKRGLKFVADVYFTSFLVQ
jgi:hypothetical protein